MDHEALRQAAADAAYPHSSNGVDWAPHVRQRRRLDLVARVDGSWRQQAACRGVDVNIFYSERGDNYGPVQRARAICAKCPVREPCLDEVIAEVQNADDYGIRGGTTATERRKIRKQRNAERRSQRKGSAA